MVINGLTSKSIALALLSLAAVSGCCCQAIPLPGENQCPTDARRLYCTCGEEAVRRCPCGPDSQFYGLKPTCWREWPEGWQCNGCEGHPYVDRGSCGEPVFESPVAEAPASVRESGDSNPFRMKSGAAELPLPPMARDLAPTQSVPAKAAPVQVVPAQPTPTAPPALEMVPHDTAPKKAAPLETAPAVKKPVTDKSADKATRVVVAASKTPEIIPAVALIPQIEPKPPLPMPIVPEAVEITAAGPILIPPQNCPKQLAAAKPNPPAGEVAALPKVEKKQTDKRTESSPAAEHAEDPAMSKRVEQHLLNNLQL
jgi:hypothetical protein